MSNIEDAEIEVEDVKISMLYRERGRYTKSKYPTFGYYIKHLQTGMIYYGTSNSADPSNFNPIEYFLEENAKVVLNEDPVYETFSKHYKNQAKRKRNPFVDYKVIIINHEKDPSMEPSRDYKKIEKIKFKVYLNIKHQKALKRSLNDKLISPKEAFCEDCKKHYIKELEDRHKKIVCSKLKIEKDDFVVFDNSEINDLIESDDEEEEEEFDV